MAIDKKGNGLDILILSERNIHSDWLTFVTWYSLFQNLPHSNVVVGLTRTTNESLRGFDWLDRVNVPNFQFKNLDDTIQNKTLGIKIAKERGLIGDSFVLLSDRTYAISSLSNDIIDLFNIINNDCINVYDAYYFSNIPNELLYTSLNNSKEFLYKNFCDLCNENTNPTFAYLEDKCGKFSLSQWKQRYDAAPFSYTQKFESDDNTNMENKILGLWHKLSAYYGTIR